MAVLSRRLLLFVFASLSSGCVSTGFVQFELEDRMLAADYEGAVAVVEGEAHGAFDGKNRLLYYLERGMLLHVSGQHAASNEAFENAKYLARKLETKSIGEAGLSLLSNDRVLAYGGEAFEHILIHLFSALNYQQLGRSESALVEARQVADALRKIDLGAGGKRVYRDDAFARYLSAMLFESEGDLKRAFVDYKKALAAYRGYDREYGVETPSMLPAHAQGVARRLGDWAVEDLSATESRVGTVAAETGEQRFQDGALGEIIILHYNGLSPVKRENRFEISVSQAWQHASVVQATASPREQEEIEQAFETLREQKGIDVIPVVFPRFESRPYSIEQMAPHVEGALRVTEPDLVEDIGAIAYEDLKDRLSRIEARAVVRAAIKWGVQKAIESRFESRFTEVSRAEDEWLRSLLLVGGNLIRSVSERADERMWSTLPDTIWMSSILVPEGVHDIRVDFMDRWQHVVEERIIRDVQVDAGGREFVIVRTVR